MHLDTRRCVLLLAACIAVAYANSLDIGFQLDDVYLLVENPAVKSLANIPRFFVDPFTLTAVHENADLRPVLQVTYALNYAVSGLSPWSYHLFALLLHVAATTLVFLLVRDRLWWPAGRGTFGALLCALAFALAPLNVQAVVSQSGRSALLCTTLYLAAFFCHVTDRRALSALAFTGALLTKAVAVTFPLMVLAYELLYPQRPLGRRLVQQLCVLGALDAAYLLYRWLLIPAFTAETFKEPFTTPGIWLMTEWSAYLYYVRQFLWPDGLSIDHEFPYTLSLLSARALVPLALIVAWLAAALLMRRRQPMVAFATVWFFLSLAPESTLAPLAEPVNEHRPYLATSLGLALLAAWAVALALDRGWPGNRAAPVVVTAALVLSCGAGVVYRNWQWHDPVRLWDDAVRKGPHLARAWMNAGVALMSRGELGKARSYLVTARALAPAYPYAHLNLSVLARAQGRHDEALAEVHEALRLRPDLGLAHYHLGLALEAAGRADEAAGAYRRAVELNPALVGAVERLSSLQSPH